MRAMASCLIFDAVTARTVAGLPAIVYLHPGQPLPAQSCPARILQKLIQLAARARFCDRQRRVLQRDLPRRRHTTARVAPSRRRAWAIHDYRTVSVFSQSFEAIQPAGAALWLRRRAIRTGLNAIQTVPNLSRLRDAAASPNCQRVGMGGRTTRLGKPGAISGKVCCGDTNSR